MPNCYADSLLSRVDGERAEKWEAKILGLDKFFTLLQVEEVPDAPDTLHIVFADAAGAKSKTHYFVHKSQVVFKAVTQQPKG
jgi:hypothetical protein